MALDDNCLFCKIIKGEIPSERVYENEDCIVIKDINPKAPVHLLLIPKTHVTDFMQSDEELMIKSYKGLRETIEKLGLYEKGFNILNNCGEAAGQTVMHIHWHILSGKKFTEGNH